MNDNIYKKLSWNASEASQIKAINELASTDSLNLNTLLQPLDKEYWGNAAKTLKLIGYPRIKEVIPGLFIWLQDLNWPGAMIIMELLKSLPKEEIITQLEFSAVEAINKNDEMWLINLSALLTAFKLQEHDFASKDVYFALVTAEEFWK